MIDIVYNIIHMLILLLIIIYKKSYVLLLTSVEKIKLTLWTLKNNIDFRQTQNKKHRLQQKNNKLYTKLSTAVDNLNKKSYSQLYINNSIKSKNHSRTYPQKIIMLINLFT